MRPLKVVALLLLLFQGPGQTTPAPPPGVTEEVRTLLKAGFGDPRGGEYRKVRVQLGSVWGGHQEVDTKGWVLPGNREVVCWNGTIYKPTSIGEPADYKQDLGKNVLKDEKAVTGRFRSLNEAASHMALGPVPKALMEILGDKDSGSKLDDNNLGKSPTQHFAWTVFDRALTHLMRGQDEEALKHARIAIQVYPRPSDKELDSIREGGGFHQTDLLAKLVPDLERRVKHPLPPFNPEDLAKLQGAARVKYLIAQLENVQATQDGQPGGISPGRTELVTALVNEGTPAVEPLFDVIERDNRLTRSVHFHRDFFPIRGIADVKAVATGALTNILQVRTVGRTDQGLDTKALRAYWAETKHLSPGLAATSLALYGLAANPGLMLASRVVAGLGAANVAVAFALTSLTYTEEERAAAMGRMSAAITLGLVAGPALGGLIAADYGQFALGMTAAGASLMGLALVPFLPATQRTEAKETTTDSKQKRSAQLNRLLLVATIGWFALATLEGTFGRLIKAQLDMGTREFGLIFGWESLTAFAVQTFLFAALLRRFKANWLLCAAFVFTGIGLFFMPTATSFAWLMVLGTVFAFGTGLSAPLVNELAAMFSPDDERGQVYGTLQASRSAGFIIGPLLGGYLFDIRPALPYALAAATCVVAAILALQLRPQPQP